VARAEAYLHAKFRLDRPTVWPQCTNVTDRTGQTGQDRTDRHRADSTVRTVLQTVAQKPIDMANEVKFLGVIFDQRLIWNADVDYVVKKCKNRPHHEIHIRFHMGMMGRV